MNRKMDDNGVAAVVGFVLILAALVTYVAYVARSEVPQWGADAEHGWDQSVGESLARLDRQAAAGVGTPASLTVTVPAAPAPHVFDVPLVTRTSPSAPTGSVSFEPDCGGMWANHTLAGATLVNDIRNGGHGCIVFREQGSYSPSYGYRAEFGGLLRIERDRAFVVAGPVLELRPDLDAAGSGKVVASATFLDLSGASNSVGAAGRAGVPIDLAARPSGAEAGETPNALTAVWTFDTPYTTAWQTWFDGQIAKANLGATSYTCVPHDPKVALCAAFNQDANQPQLGVVLNGGANPLALSISYGRYDVNVR